MENDLEKEILETESKLNELKAQVPKEPITTQQGGGITAPIAIVIAGIIIAGAILYSGAGSSKNAGVVAVAPTPTKAVAPQVENVKKVTKDDHILGSLDAEVFLIEYSDIECPFCKRMHPVAQRIVDSYDGKVAWVYRHFPLAFHVNAQKEAEATECAAEQGGNDAFWAYTNTLYERTTSNGTGFALSALVPLAKELGLNEQEFKTCLDSGKFAAKIASDIQGGSDAGVRGTPGNILLSKSGEAVLVSGAQPFTAFKSVIDRMLQ